MRPCQSRPSGVASGRRRLLPCNYEGIVRGAIGEGFVQWFARDEHPKVERCGHILKYAGSVRLWGQFTPSDGSKNDLLCSSDSIRKDSSSCVGDACDANGVREHDCQQRSPRSAAHPFHQ